MIEAYDNDFIKIAEYSFNQPYNSTVVPVTVGKITNISIKDGVLTWSAYSGASSYSVGINNCTDNESWNSTESTSFNVNNRIDKLIKRGDFINKSPYSIEIFAYDKDGIKLAAGSIEHDYTSKENPIAVGTIDNAAISADGILTWNPYPDAYIYTVYIANSGETIRRTSYDLNKEIDRSIKAGFLKKTGSYSIRIVAEDFDNIKLAEWSYDYTYNSPAEPVTVVPITNAQVTNGILTWDRVNDVDEYVVEINNSNRYVTNESLDLYATIDKLINGEFPEELKDLFTGENGLFPNPAEISFICSCPDWAIMCKHVAAVMYGIGVRFDENPFFFFHLRGIDIDRFIDVTLENKVESMLQNADADSPRILHETADLTELFGVL